MKFKEILLRIGLSVAFLVSGAFITILEIGVSELFNLKVRGMSYAQYLHEFYQVPWHVWTATAILIVGIFFAVECTAKGWFKD